MSAGLRCWMRWMWYGYIPSVYSICQTLMRGTKRRAEILRVLVREFRCTMSIIFSSFSTFRCIWRSALRLKLGKEPFSRICWWTHVCQGFFVEDFVADILRQQQWRYRCKPLIQNAYQSILLKKITCVELLLTAQLSQYEMAAPFAIWSTPGLVTWVSPPCAHPLHWTAANSATVANRTQVYVYSMAFVTQNELWN